MNSAHELRALILAALPAAVFGCSGTTGTNSPPPADAQSDLAIDDRPAPPDAIGGYVTRGKGVAIHRTDFGDDRLVPGTVVVIAPRIAHAIYGERAGWIRSEALMRLDFGKGRLPGLLVLGAEDPHQFRASQGTDLLGFFAGVFERTMRRWLS